MKINCLIQLVFLFAVLLAAPNYSRGGHLPTKSYTTFDGLTNDGVNKIVRDSRGFLWFCTGEGLSRFDGFEFKNYTQNEGLPHRNINDFLETKDGDFLIATTGGLAVFDPHGAAYRWNILTSKLEQNSAEPPMFRTFRTPNADDLPKARSVLTLIESRNGEIYAGTGTALFQLKKSGGEWIYRQIESDLFNENTVFAALQFDSAGYLWLVTSTGIYRMSPDGAVENMGGDGGGSVLVDKQGQIWVGGSGTNSGLRVFTISGDSRTAQLERVYRTADGLPLEHSMGAIYQTSDGRILIIIGDALCEFTPHAGETEVKFRIVIRGAFQTLAEDDGGNLWLGTIQEGALKLVPNGFVIFDGNDGIPSEDITSLFFNRAAELFITSGKQKILRLTGGEFESIIPNGVKSRSWGINQLDFQTANGDWWITSNTGLRIYPKPDSFTDLVINQPKQILTTADGLFSDEIFNLFEDSRGDVWISAIGTADTLQRWERKNGKVHRYSTAADSLPNSNGATNFGEDADGNVWFGFFFGGLARLRNGVFQFFNEENGIPVGAVNSIFFDKSGRLWIASASRGVFRADDPTADNPTFVNLSTAEGLSSNRANCVTGDDFGRIYIGTGRGINRLDPGTGNIKFYTPADGLPGSVVTLCQRDSTGALWFVSRNNLVKFVPQTETRLPPPPIYISEINVNGAARKISELGANDVGQMDFDFDQRQIKIGFFAVGFGSGDQIRYQYKLENHDWSAPDEQKSITFNLGFGDYRFQVRAVNADGAASEQPAAFSFTIAPPVYRRWWFLLLSGLFIAAVIFGLDRFRVKKTRQVETALDISRESEERFRTLAQTASDAIITIDKNSRIVFVNDAVEKIFGYSVKELIGEDLTILMPGAMRGAHHAGLKRYLETAEKHISWAAIELPGKHKNGGKIPLEISFGEFTTNGERYFTGIARDISERKKAEETLQLAFSDLSASENRFRQMNEQSPLGIIVFAPDGSIHAVNRAYENFWGISFEQIKDWDFFADEQLIKIGVVEKMRRVFAGETVNFPPEPYDPRDNNHGVKLDDKAALPWFESFAYPVKNDAGELLEVILVMEDVTDTKRADEIEQTARRDRLRELEQVRRRIAADLHDDIGSSLTQISVWSEVLQQRVDQTNHKLTEPLEYIAGSSRELVDAMSDIVWAINPQKDFLSELSGKMRRFAADIFTARDVEFTFDAPHLAEEFALGANLRREVFLIFKESINNIVKHAHCSRVKIVLKIEDSEIYLSLRDDGRGFETAETFDGHGLVSMKQRATGLGGTLSIVSGKTTGTTTTIVAPLNPNAAEKVLSK
jgi:PAS domain S-box-containing protein